MQLGVDLFLLPEEGLQVLHPFEVRDDDAARVGEYVRDDEHAALMQDRVGLGRDGRVCSFGDQASPNPAGVVPGDLVLHRRRHEHGHRQLEQLRICDRISFLESAHAAAHLAVLVKRGEVQPLRVVDTALRVADGHHP